MKKLLFTLLLLITCTITIHAQADDLALPNYSPKELKKITKKANKGDVQSMKLLYQYYWSEEHIDSMLGLKYLQLAADAGDMEAQTSIGYGYASGSYGLTIDYDKALYYTRKAANQNYDSAIYNLGLFYFNGAGVEQDFDKASAYFKQAAMKGLAPAQFYYGTCLSIDSTDIDQANFWIQKSADQGYIPAFAVVAEHYLNQEDYAQAIKYAQMAADAGDAVGMSLLATMYYLGSGAEKDLEQARYWAQQAADQENNAGYTILGLIYYDEENYLFAKAYLEKGAQLGNNRAREALAEMYHEGKGVEKDAEKARAFLTDAIADGDEEAKLLLSLYNLKDNHNDLDAVAHDEQSIDSNDPIALLILSARYKEGMGVEQDLKKAFQLCKKAADMGYAPAQYDLASYYRHGQGTAKDDREAFNYLLKSAKQDCDIAYGTLSDCYYFGRGTAVNYPEARYWAEKGVEKDDTIAYYIMGIYYYQGAATAPNYEKALSYFQKCADLGSSDGLYGCFLCHHFGDDAIRNGVLAFKELKQAVELFQKNGIESTNIPLAYYNMGICYQNGEGTAKDTKKAFYWFTKAAKEQNNDNDPNVKKAIGSAQYNVAYYYYNGIGTAVNKAKAKYWLKKSAANDCNEAKETLKRMK